MFIVIGCMFAGAAAGYLLRHRPYKKVSHVITALIWLLLFLLGWEVGCNEELIRSLPKLGGEAWLLATLAVAGSCLAAWGLSKSLPSPRNRATSTTQETQEKTPSQGIEEASGSLIILGFFIIGILGGLLSGITDTRLLSDISFAALCALMACVGFSVGNRPETLRSFRHIHPRLALLPLMTVIGTLTGSVVAAWVLRHTVTECMAVGSGFGYYSLSSILITEAKGAELGTVALLSNIIRELYALLAAPLLVRWWGKLAPIAAGGATTADTTLPVITRYGGQELIAVSIYHGILVDFSVPFLVTLFCGW